MLYVDRTDERIRAVAPAYLAFATRHGLDSALHDDARRHDTPRSRARASRSRWPRAACSAAFGWDAVFERAPRSRSGWPSGCTSAAASSPRAPRPRWWPGRTRRRRTRAPGSPTQGVILRDLPGTSYLRASVGAWNDETDLERLLEAAVNEQFARVNDDIELCYETFGDPADPTVLLVMGLATQMLGWDEDFCELLAGRGFHVVRFDNRDVGRSTRLVDVAPPSLSS